MESTFDIDRDEARAIWEPDFDRPTQDEVADFDIPDAGPRRPFDPEVDPF